MLKKSDYNHLIKTSSWCSMPWSHLFINPQGEVKPCCRFKMDTVEKENWKVSGGNKSFGEIFLSPLMNDIREKMLQNEKIDGCLRCYQEEASGKKSLRQRYNQSENLPPDRVIMGLKKPKIKWIELAISNDCNLACRMCDSRYSTKWFNDEMEFYGWTFNRYQKTKCDINTITPFLKDLVHVKFTGGEPLMIPGHLTLIDRMMELENVGDISLEYSTNLTIKPSESLVEKWKKFKYVQISCSFDGVGKTWELVRYPGRWEKSEKILRCFFQLSHTLDCRIGLRSTISVNNILGMADSFKWWTENWSRYASNASGKQFVNPTHLTFPRFLSVTVLPKKYKDIVAEKLFREGKDFSVPMRTGIESQINHMFSKDDSKYLKELKDYTLHFDRKRGQDFFEANPELKGIFDEVPMDFAERT